MKTYRAEFFTVADWAFRDIEAETPKQALQIAREFYDDHLVELNFCSYDDIEPLDLVQIWKDGEGALATWESEEYRLRMAAKDLLEALESQTKAAQTVIDNWEEGDLAGAVRDLDRYIQKSRAALAKVLGDG